MGGWRVVGAGRSGGLHRGFLKSPPPQGLREMAAPGARTLMTPVFPQQRHPVDRMSASRGGDFIKLKYYRINKYHPNTTLQGYLVNKYFLI